MSSRLILENEGWLLSLPSVQCITLHQVIHKWAVSLAYAPALRGVICLPTVRTA